MHRKYRNDLSILHSLNEWVSRLFVRRLLCTFALAVNKWACRYKVECITCGEHLVWQVRRITSTENMITSAFRHRVLSLITIVLKGYLSLCSDLWSNSNILGNFGICYGCSSYYHYAKLLFVVVASK